MSESSNIQVFLRIRPTKKPSGFYRVIEENSQVNFDLPVDTKYVNNSKSSFKFKFNDVLDMDISQDNVYQKLGRPALLNALDGYNSTIFAYGQTGSGKTYSITGGSDYDSRGLLPRLVQDMFGEFETREKNEDCRFTCRCSYLEIYNGRGHDLLKSNEDEMVPVRLRADENDNFQISGLSQTLCMTREDAIDVMLQGEDQRQYEETSMNMNSSRSHCIFTIEIESKKPGSATVKRSKIHVVDLAGSERVSKTNATGIVLKQAQNINTSLHFLERVIVALHDQAKKGREQHIPYRQCLLTSILRDSLGGNCKTAMLATISGTKEQTQETISTCRFSQRVASIQNSAIVNEETDPYVIISTLKERVKTLEEELAFAQGELSDNELSEMELNTLNTTLQRWMRTDRTEKPDIGAPTPAKLDAMFQILGRHCGPGAGEIVDQMISNNGNNTMPIGNGGGSAMDIKIDQELRDRVEKMAKTLRDRDREIRTLAKMVRDLNEGAKNFSDSFNSRGGTSNGRSSSSYGRGSTAGSPMNVPPPKKITRVGLAIVELLPDKSPLNDIGKAEKLFKNSYEQRDAFMKLSDMVKDKAVEGKRLGDLIRRSRKAIEDKKRQLQQIKALQVSEGDLEGIPTEEEKVCMSDLDDLEAEYCKDIQKLKDTKKQYDDVKLYASKKRSMMTKHFEAWYAAMRNLHGLRNASSAWEEPTNRASTPTMNNNMNHPPATPPASQFSRSHQTQPPVMRSSQYSTGSSSSYTSTSPRMSSSSYRNAPVGGNSYTHNHHPTGGIPSHPAHPAHPAQLSRTQPSNHYSSPSQDSSLPPLSSGGNGNSSYSHHNTIGASSGVSFQDAVAELNQLKRSGQYR
eukprot:TRINITY_DN295_c0_g2_i1.p1 TRINITY_DN295_c0_g2~~TRINITY_DN295_c0_g2_i1.p1  ORF type:complete len:856 (-),score=210.49 TRINITY_DN295_c0_g2_i1:766-3333(-)